MKTAKKGVFQPSKIIPSDAPTKARLKAVGEAIKGRDVFEKSNKRAEALLKGVREIPVPK
jgi:hypothetical protein